LLTIKNLLYTYAPNHTIYTFDLAMQAGEIVGILGESGSGKSTMLDLIAGFLDADSGAVALGTEPLLGLSIEKRPITILFQQHNLFEHLSVEKNILLGIDPKGRSSTEARQRISQILEEMKLSDHRKKLPSALSGGQQQRVALARALLRRQPILLLDEPFSGLDRETRLEMLALVQKITHQHKLYTLMVTHETEDCTLIADKVYKMKDGTLLPYNPATVETTAKESRMFAATPKPPYYAVIFTSSKINEDKGYGAMSEKMVNLVQKQEGFLGFESAREEIGITVSYWKDEASILAWKAVLAHKEAQKLGKSTWYPDYKIRIAKVERDYEK